MRRPISAATQAAFLVKAYRYVERFPWVKALFWYAARNSPFLTDRCSLGFSIACGTRIDVK